MPLLPLSTKFYPVLLLDNYRPFSSAFFNDFDLLFLFPGLTVTLVSVFSNRFWK